MAKPTVNDTLRIANGELGYRETGTNHTKYADDLDAIKYFNSPKQNIEWCGTFDYWCIWMATGKNKSDALAATYQPSYDNCACGCKYGAQYFRNKGAWYSTPKRGDVVFYSSKGSEYHQGLVDTELDGSGYFYAIEGNHNNKVDYVKRSLSECAGFGRPDYADGPSPEPHTNTYTVKTNSGVDLMLRAEPNTKSSVIGSIPNGTTFTAEKVVEGESIGYVTTWVYYKGGYASGRYLLPIPVINEPEPDPQPTPDPVTQREYTVSVNSYLAIRTGPGTNYEQVGKLTNGSVITIVERSENWGKIINSDLWVCTDYLK